MFCPRCGRAVNEKANFCGGCGLSRAEIENYIRMTQPAEPAEEVKAEVPFGTIVNEPVSCTEEDAVVCAENTARDVSPALYETPAEPAAEPMPESIVDAVADMVEEAKTEEPKAAYTPPVPPQPQHDYGYNTQYAQQEAPQPAPQPAKNENLSTVDFIWMFIISGIPLVGFIYLICLAVQNNNTNKRSYARATLLVMLFSLVVAVVFAVGILAAGVI